MMNSKPRVLLIAEACNPAWTSVPLVGYNLYRALSELAEVTLVTQVRNEPALTGNGSAAKTKISFIDSEAVAAPFHRFGKILTLGRGLGWTTKQAVMWLPYLYFERLVYYRFRDALERGEFDLIHRVTPLTPTYPSLLASWSSVPFVLGPINGGLPWPKGTTRVRLAEMEWLSYLRDLYRILPYLKKTYNRAALIIAGSRYTESSLPRSARARCVYMPENGIDPARFHAGGRLPPSRVHPFRLLYVGRLVPYKGAHLVLKALAAARDLRSTAELVIVGDGPQKKELESLTGTLGLASQVTFTGNLPQDRVVEYYRESSLFVFPSLREFGGAVVIEAMACGLPCVVLDYGGPGEYVTPETGVAIPLGSPEQMVAGLQAALERLHGDRDGLDAMSAAGLQRVAHEYAWSSKARRIVGWYERVLAERRPSECCREEGIAVRAENV